MGAPGRGKGRGVMKRILLKSCSRPSSIWKTEERESVRIIRLQGPMGMETVSELERFWKKIKGQKTFRRKNILLDFGKVTHTDSATVAALINATFIFKEEHQKLGMINLGDKLLSLFEIFQVNNLVYFFSTEADALKQLSGPGKTG